MSIRAQFGLALLCAILTVFAPTAVADWKIGDRVVVSKAAELRVRLEAVDQVPVGAVLEILQLNGKWLWVKHNQAGWLDEGSVISLPAHISALRKGGDKAIQNKRYEEAKTLFSQILELDPGDKHALLAHANADFAEGQYIEAIAGYDRALESDPENHDIFLARGNAWSRLEDYANAIEDYSRVIALTPRDDELFRLRGISRLKIADTDAAIVDLTVAIRLSKSSSSRALSHEERAKSWLLKGDFAAAAADRAIAARLEPRNPSRWNSAAWILAVCPDDKVRDGAIAVQYALKACDLTNYRSANVLDTLAAAYAEAGQFQPAATNQSKALALASEPDKADYRSRLDLYQSGKPFRDPNFGR